MVTREDELVAWKKLKETFPYNYVTMELEYEQNRLNEEQINYIVYVATTSSYLSDKQPTPMKAVNNIIEIVKEEEMRNV